MIFHFTDRLRRKLKIAPLSLEDQHIDPLFRWYTNYFTSGGTHYVLSTNAASLYSVVMYGRGVNTLDKFSAAYRDTLRFHLDEDGFSTAIDRLNSKHEILPMKCSNHSVLGSMNDMMRNCKWHLRMGEHSPQQLTRNLNEMPSMVIEPTIPKDAFAQFFRI